MTLDDHEAAALRLDCLQIAAENAPELGLEGPEGLIDAARRMVDFVMGARRGPRRPSTPARSPTGAEASCQSKSDGT